MTRARKAVAQSIEIIRRRIDLLGTKEPAIRRRAPTGSPSRRPGESDPREAEGDVIGKTAKLTFQMVDDSVQRRKTRPPAAFRRTMSSLPNADPKDPAPSYVLVKRRSWSPARC